MDSARALTPQGIHDARDMAMLMQSHIGRVDIVITSPFERAKQTADIMAPALGCDLIVTTTALEPDATPEAAWAEVQRLAQQAGDVLVVTHDPFILEFIGWFIMMGYEKGFGAAGIHMKHAEIAAVHTDEGFRGRLHWMATRFMAEQQHYAREVDEAALAFMESLNLIERGRGDGGKRSYTYEETILKRWVLGDGGRSGNCEICVDNADRGWIDVDDVFDGADGDIDDAPAHPNCTCPAAETKVSRRRVYD